MLKRLSSINPQLRLFLIGMAFLGATGSIFETTFNNFLSDIFNVTADTRGYIEFPRELPGFLTALFAGLLFFLPETGIAAASALAIGGGMIGLALCGNSWTAMLLFMVMWSAGAHLLMPIRASIALMLSNENKMGRRLGEVHAVGIGASIVGCLVVWLGMKFVRLEYSKVFLIGAIAAFSAALAFVRMDLPGAHLKRPKFILRRKYWLFYVLASLFGARKQIFITFGPWVLVRVFHQKAEVIAQLWMASAIIGIFFQPMLGRLIDKVGERAVLMTDSVCVMGVCLGYGFSDRIGDQSLALYLLYACFIGDLLLFGVNMARSTYLAKIASDPSHVAPTLSLGITINHAVSMTVPAIGGLVWMQWGHPWVFLVASGVAVLMFIFSSFVYVCPTEERNPSPLPPPNKLIWFSVSADPRARGTHHMTGEEAGEFVIPDDSRLSEDQAYSQECGNKRCKADDSAYDCASPHGEDRQPDRLHADLKIICRKRRIPFPECALPSPRSKNPPQTKRKDKKWRCNDKKTDCTTNAL